MTEKRGIWILIAIIILTLVIGFGLIATSDVNNIPESDTEYIIEDPSLE